MVCFWSILTSYSKYYNVFFSFQSVYITSASSSKQKKFQRHLCSVLHVTHYMTRHFFSSLLPISLRSGFFRLVIDFLFFLSFHTSPFFFCSLILISVCCQHTIHHTHKSNMSSNSRAIKLYGMAMSTCTRRVRCVLEEMGLPYEIVLIDLGKGEQKQPTHLLIQPFGQVPVLEDTDGTKIFESRAIMRYLLKKYPTEGDRRRGNVKRSCF